MEITSISFVVFVAVVVLAFYALPYDAYRLGILTTANIVFIVSFVTEFQQIVPLFAFLLLGYLTIEAVRCLRANIIMYGGISVVLVTYVFLKKFSFLDGLTLEFSYLVVGLSYVLFRVLHLIIDTRGGDIAERIKPISFFNYTCNFLTFVSGPIQSYQDFANSPNHKTAGLSDDFVFRALRRIISGYVKVVIISGIANYFYLHIKNRILGPDLAPQGARLIVEYGCCALIYTVYLYFNFAGYMDIVIGVGRLLGQNLPENFNKPFLARNFLEFWTRWHMTLSQWFKTYLFNPLMGLLIDRVPQSAMVPYLGVAAFFITFSVMGIWHGTTMVFAIYGLLMGAGASINKLWQLVMADRLGRRGYRALSEQTLYIYCCRGITCSFFALGITCLWVNMDQLNRLSAALGPIGLLTTLLLTAVVCAIAMFLQDFVLLRAKKWVAWTDVLSRRGVFGNFCSAAQILLILMVSTFFHKVPEFVYRAF